MHYKLLFQLNLFRMIGQYFLIKMVSNSVDQTWCVSRKFVGNLYRSKHSVNVFKKVSHRPYSALHNDFSQRSIFMTNIKKSKFICIIRQFKTSCPHNVHPAVALVVRPVARVLVALIGRFLRTWWRRLPEHRKQAVTNHFKKHYIKYAGCTAVLCGSCTTIYYQHCEACPYTEKTRFLLFRPEHMAELDEMVFQEEITRAGDRLLDSQTAEVQTVLRVGNRLAQAHEMLAAKKWQVAVIENPEMNCYCLSSGHVVLYTGMMAACANENQLAVVLAHEMAHVLLQHQNIKMSHECLVDVFLLPVTLLAWGLSSSDLLSLFMSWLFERTSALSLVLPYSRQLETEADVVGLAIMALACYDVREASAFWQQQHLLEQHQRLLSGASQGLTASAETVTSWLSTHPSYEARHAVLDDCMPGAVRWREQLQCPCLSPVDPRTFVKRLSADVQTRGNSATENIKNKNNLMNRNPDVASDIHNKSTFTNSHCSKSTASGTASCQHDCSNCCLSPTACQQDSNNCSESLADYYAQRAARRAAHVPRCPGCHKVERALGAATTVVRGSGDATVCGCFSEEEYISLPAGVQYEDEASDVDLMGEKRDDSSAGDSCSGLDSFKTILTKTTKLLLGTSVFGFTSFS